MSVYVSTNKSRTPYELFSGLIYDNLEFEKIRQLRIVRFVARSYAVILTTRMLNQQQIQYSRGLCRGNSKTCPPYRRFQCCGCYRRAIGGRNGVLWHDFSAWCHKVPCISKGVVCRIQRSFDTVSTMQKTLRSRANVGPKRYRKSFDKEMNRPFDICF